MNAPDDNLLLRRYAADRSEGAFGELVARHVPLVYSAALRQTGGDAHLAQDVAQLVFADLARKAHALSESVVLAGWLHRASIFAARQILRGERRRRAREQEAVLMNAMQSEPDNPDWKQIGPLLDEALEHLNPADRDAVLLRFFEQLSLAEVGARLGASEDAARKRVDRALEKLRVILTRRGVGTSVAALATVMSAHAVQLPPAGLAASLTTTSLAAAGTGTLANLFAAAKLKYALAALAVTGAGTAVVLQHQAEVRLNASNEALTQQLARQQTDNLSLSNRLAAIGAAKALSDAQFTELLTLRGEVGVLRNQLGELQKISEDNQPLTATAVATPAPQPTGARSQERLMLVLARHGAEACFQYANEHQQQFPTNLAQTAPYLTGGLNWDQIETNFDLAYQGSVTNILFPSATIVLKEKQPRQTQAGLWLKTYAFADGHGETRSDPPNDFDEWEGHHTEPPSASPPTAGAPGGNPALWESKLINQGARACLRYAFDHDQQFPATLAQAAPYLITDVTLAQIETNAELVFQGSLTNLADPAATLVLREKEPWQAQNGLWKRAYAFADGHGEIHSEPANNFDPWERQHLFVPPANQ
jgi:RNA polymerase sigma factor (sigma-70 family)